jgi:alkylation response protein AidB-like acyl-CoA dehydrogenase
MDFDFTEPEKQLFTAVAETAAALASEVQTEDCDPVRAADHLRTGLKRLAALDYLALETIGRRQGPDGPLALMRAMTELAGRCPSVFLAAEYSTRVFGRALAAWGDADQKTRWLEPLTAGQTVGALALSEGAMNVENDPLAAAARRQGNTIVVSGRKQSVVNAPAADTIAVAGVLEEKPALFLLAAGTPGLTVGERYPTLGYDGVLIADVELNDCPVASEAVICPPDMGRMLATLRLWENQVLVAAAVGQCAMALDAARNHAKTHRSGGRPIIAYQEVGFKLAEMLTLHQTAEWLAYRAAWTAAAHPKDAEGLTLCAKVFATEAAEKVAGAALQILSSVGYRRGNPAEIAYRGAKFGQIAGTSTEIARVQLGDSAMGWR